jgi:hypothetical protein
LRALPSPRPKARRSSQNPVSSGRWRGPSAARSIFLFRGGARPYHAPRSISIPLAGKRASRSTSACLPPFAFWQSSSVWPSSVAPSCLNGVLPKARSRSPACGSRPCVAHARSSAFRSFASSARGRPWRMPSWNISVPLIVLPAMGGQSPPRAMVPDWRSWLLLIRRAQAIANAGLGQHELRPLRIGLYLLAELADIDAQILRVGEFVPQLLQ